MEIVAPNLAPWLLALPLLSIVLFAIALIHLIRTRLRSPSIKLFWLIVVLIIPIVGPVLYFLIGMKDQEINAR